MNELVFLLQTLLISSSTLLGVWLGPAALTTFIVTYCLLANLFVLKTITLFGMTATAADAFTIGATLGLNLLQEYFGKKATKTAMQINIAVLLLYLILTQIHLWYVPSSGDITQSAYLMLLAPAPRILIASFTVYFVAQQIDCTLYGTLIAQTPTSWLLVRNYGSVIVSQLFDTVAFSFFGLYGLVDNIGQIILVSYTVKLVALALCSPFLLLSRRIITH
jgi:queuosine precursor transporter